MGWFKKLESGFILGLSPADYAKSVYDERSNSLQSEIDALQRSGINSRDQIINPAEILSNYSFGNSASERKKYNEYLKLLTDIQAQQQASYDEWYSSPEQEAIRMRQAGLNPDILGISGSGVPDTNTNDLNPLEGVPSNGEIFNNVISGISSIVGSLSSVASLATAFTSIPLTKQNISNAQLLGEQLDLQNESSLGALLASDIADLFATAQNVHLRSNSSEPFNIEQWFSDDANFAPLSAIYGNSPRFASQLNKQRNAVMQHMTKASQMQKDLSSNIYDTGEIISSPFYSDDQKITMIQLRPFIAACAEADTAEVKLRKTLADIRDKYSSGLDIDKAIDVANLQNKYQSDYYTEANGHYVAAFEQYLRDVSKPAYELERSINQSYLDLFNSDPSGSGAWKAAYLFGSKGGSSWKEAYLIRNDESFSSFIDAEIELAKASGDFARLSALANVLQNFTPHLEKTDVNFVQYYKNYYEKIEKVLNLMGEDVDIIK